MRTKKGFTICELIIVIVIIALMGAVLIPIFKHVASGDLTEWQRLENPDRAKTITVYSNGGAELKAYQSVGYVNVGRSGCYFIDSETGRKVRIQGNFIVE